MEPTCSACKWWKPLQDNPESWGTCEYCFPFLPFWAVINQYGAISPKHYGCPTWESAIDGVGAELEPVTQPEEG